MKEEGECNKVHLRNIWFDNSTRHCKNARVVSAKVKLMELALETFLLTFVLHSILEKTIILKKKPQKS